MFIATWKCQLFRISRVNKLNFPLNLSRIFPDGNALLLRSLISPRDRLFRIFRDRAQTSEQIIKKATLKRVILTERKGGEEDASFAKTGWYGNGKNKNNRAFKGTGRGSCLFGIMPVKQSKPGKRKITVEIMPVGQEPSLDWFRNCFSPDIFLLAGMFIDLPNSIHRQR